MIQIPTHSNLQIISDLHSGNPNLTDDHIQACKAALNPARYDTLVLLGDCLDRTRSARPGRFEAEFLSICRQFETWIVVLGNHEWPYDQTAATYKEAGADKVCTKYRFYSGDELFICEHGHRFDPNCNGENALYWNRALVRTTTFLDKLFKCDVQEWLRGKKWIDKALRDIENDRGIKKRAIKEYKFLLEEPWVIIGHRHAPLISYRQKFCDAGDWVQHKSYVTIDEGRVELHE